jgi:hypothetical protein
MLCPNTRISNAVKDGPSLIVNLWPHGYAVGYPYPDLAIILFFQFLILEIIVAVNQPFLPPSRHLVVPLMMSLSTAHLRLA